MKPRGEQHHVFLRCCYASSPHLALSLSLPLPLSLARKSFLEVGVQNGCFNLDFKVGHGFKGWGQMFSPTPLSATLPEIAPHQEAGCYFSDSRA